MGNFSFFHYIYLIINSDISKITIAFTGSIKPSYRTYPGTCAYISLSDVIKNYKTYDYL